MGANDRQVAGTHYAGAYQHWDFVLGTGQSYLQGCTTKYISRHRKKHGATDLEKALHYIDKMEEVRQAPAERHGVFLNVFAKANDLTESEKDAIGCVLSAEWGAARRLIRDLLVPYSPTCNEASGADS